MKVFASFPLLLLLPIFSCSNQSGEEKLPPVSELPFLEGSAEYLPSPFVTAGDRVYMVGHQDGTFPDIGWHIDGEMGGIWDHPIKLMDGFTTTAQIKGSNNSFCLNKAGRFVNYPMANSHYFHWSDEDISFERFQFAPDSLEGIIVWYKIHNTGNDEKDLTFSFTGLTDLRPTWLGERTGMVDSQDEIRFDDKSAAVIAKDQNSPWYTAFGSNATDVEYTTQAMPCAPATKKGLGAAATLSLSLHLEAGEEKVIPFFIAGSYKSEDALRENLETMRKESGALFSRKAKRYQNIRERSMLTIPDKGIEEMYEWVKYNTEWLVRHVPEQGIGVSAGLPDYPWWFGTDMTYTLQGLLATGGHELAKQSILLTNNISKKTNGNGRIIHEVSTNGSVYNPGNVNETAQFISVVNTYLAWTGDTELAAALFPDLQKGLRWLTEEMDPDGNGYPNGSGMMEIHGLDTEMIDVAVYTQQAFSDAAEIAMCLGKTEAASEYRKEADDLRRRINEEWWNSREQSFGDFRGTVAEAKPVLEAALVRADTLQKPWAVSELIETRQQLSRYPAGRRFPHVIYHNWVVNTPMETGIADEDKGRKALETAKRYENAFGVFVTGIDRTQEADSVVLKSRKKTFSYTGAVMTLPTGVQAVAAARYGATQDALNYLQKLRRSFSFALPGSMYEVSPDFGMAVQAWNIYGVAVPIVRHFFGIQPKAYDKTIHLSPQLPDEWKSASIENVIIGNNTLGLYIRKHDDHTEYRITQSKHDWTITVDISNASKATLDDQPVKAGPSNGYASLTGEEMILRLYR